MVLYDIDRKYTMRCECRGRGFIARQHRTVRSTVLYGIPIKHFLLLHAGPYYCSTYLRTISIKINSDVSTVGIFYHMYIRCWHLYLVSYSVSHNFDLQEIVFCFVFFKKNFNEKFPKVSHYTITMAIKNILKKKQKTISCKSKLCDTLYDTR